jgi:hypothetical protein
MMKRPSNFWTRWNQIFLKKQQNQKPMGISKNSSKKATEERIQQDKEELIVKINELRDDKIVLQ